MPKDEEVLVQLATRVPRELHRDIKLHCVSTGTSVMDFVASALTAKLRGKGRGVAARRKRS